MNSNSLVVKAKIRAYIIDCVQEADGLDDEERLLYAYEEFQSIHAREIKLHGEVHAFSYWVKGLPTIFSVDYDYMKIRSIVQEWLNLSDEKAEKYDNQETADYFYYLIYREFCSMITKMVKE